MGEPSLDTPITVDQLRVFLAVVDEGSFSSAARRLRRVQSAVSYSIANLERLLSVELFDRGGRMPVLTAAGRALLPDARAVCERMDRLQARARSIAEGIEPRLNVAVDAMFPLAPLLRALRELGERFPFAALHLRTEALGAVAQLVVDGTCEIGIGIELEELPRELTLRPLGGVELAPVSAPCHPLAGRAGPLTREDLREEVQIVLTDRSALTEGRDRGVYSDRTWRVADLEAKRELILGGFGWGQMPLHRVERDLASGTVVRLTLARGASYLVPMCAMFRTADPPGPAGRWLLEHLSAD